MNGEWHGKLGYPLRIGPILHTNIIILYEYACESAAAAAAAHKT